jgi:uncharacterized 2Fe-2S/4Fe-4S cluster protein (DUF4445 family)
VAPENVTLEVVTEDGESVKTRVVVLPRGHRDIASALRRAGLPLNTRCGGIGMCEGCSLEPVSGKFEHRTSGATVDGRYAGTIRACQHRVLPADHVAVVRVKQRNTLNRSAAAHDQFDVRLPSALRPLWRQAPRDDGSVAIEEFELGTFRETRSISEPVLDPLGVAIDVGTTTVAVLLVRLTDGTILDRAADFNRQIFLGDDVLSRITLCTSDPTMLGQLQRAILHETILPLASVCLERQRRASCDVVCGAVAGNTTMLHLLAGVDPVPLGVAPFAAAFLDHRVERALFDPSGEFKPALHLLPGASAYVGSDLTAGMIACAVEHGETPSLLIDVGTNGEMILALGDRMVGCATAAGPAFEGSGLSSGIRAADGAIAHIRFDHASPFMHLTRIGTSAKPIGLCGSFYVDFLAEARRVGLVSERGHLVPDALPALADRFGTAPCAGQTFRVAGTNDERAIVVSESDIAKLLAAKAAIAAGALTLLEREGLTPADVRTLHLAGGFGAKVSVDNAIACGLLPGFTPDQVRVVGNSSLAGAYLALLDADCLQRMRALARRVDVIELNTDPGFEDRYLDQLRL